MENGVKVSVIMPSLNVAPYIRECLDSVCAQSLRDIEILCVDAGSTDGTLDFLRSRAQEDPRVRVIVSERKSYGYQMNLGMRQARGDYIGIVETDDYIAPDMLQGLYDLACRHDLDVVKGSFYRFTGDGDERSFEYAPIAEDKNCGRVLNPSADPSLMDLKSLYSWAGLYRRAFLEEKGVAHNETPGASYQDNGFFFQVFSQARRLYFTKKAYYYLRRDNPNSSINSSAKVYCMCEEYDFIRAFLKKDAALEERFAPMCARWRMYNYDFTFRRVAKQFKREFMQRYAADFRKLRDAGELSAATFSKTELARLERIMADPDLACFCELGRAELFDPPAGETEEDLRLRLRAAALALDAETDKNALLRRSTPYRLGKALLWLPDKLRGGVQCVRDHGLGYTLRLALGRIKH